MIFRHWFVIVAAMVAAGCSDDDSPSNQEIEGVDEAGTTTSRDDAGTGLNSDASEPSGSIDTNTDSQSSESDEPDASPDLSFDASAADAGADSSEDAGFTASFLSRPSLPRPPIDGRLPADMWPPIR